MSSRARFMLQDFQKGSALTGREAFEALQSIYNTWVKSRQAPSKAETILVWVKASEEYRRAHPFNVQLFLAQVPDMDWDGTGHYRQVYQKPKPAVAAPPKELSKGPRWLRALEMWQQLEPTHNHLFRLWVSRDNRRQSWRRSLCNPYFQGWGFKPRPNRPIRAKKASKQASTSGRTRNRWGGEDPEFAIPAIRDLDAPLPGRTGTAAPAKAPKPAVGIWS